ncbi:MAG: TIGR02444 family protein [Pseudomonadota bacterium]
MSEEVGAADAPENVKNWANAVYARSGVSDALLQLQDRIGADVCLVLWCCWAGERFKLIPEPVMRLALDRTAHWNADATRSLREARRAMKLFLATDDYQGVHGLREKVKALELEAEYVELGVLGQIAERFLTAAEDIAGSDGAASRARKNLALYAGLAGLSKAEDFSTGLLHNVIDNIFGGR